MSVEIYGSNDVNANLVREVGVEVARILTETGVQGSLAHTIGLRAGEYGAALLLSTQEMLGEVSPGNCSDTDFVERMKSIGKVTTNPDIEGELFPEQYEIIMANTTALKRRITSVKNTKQITKAMELVSASKMRRAQEQAVKTRDYSKLARAILTRLRERTDVSKHPLFTVREVNNRLFVVITSDRGLAGAYNSNVLRRLTRELRAAKEANENVQIIVVGKQASHFVSRFEDINVIAAYTDFPEQPTPNQIRPILNTVTEMYEKSEVDSVDVIYTDYKSSIVQEIEVQRILPAAFTETHIYPDLDAAIFEPSARAVLDTVTVRLIDAQLAQVFYEAQASEHSMRMMAMKSATDNANDLVDDLTLAFNTARQAGITQELAEITGGAEAIK